MYYQIHDVSVTYTLQSLYWEEVNIRPTQWNRKRDESNFEKIKLTLTEFRHASVVKTFIWLFFSFKYTYVLTTGFVILGGNHRPTQIIFYDLFFFYFFRHPSISKLVQKIARETILSRDPNAIVRGQIIGGTWYCFTSPTLNSLRFNF